MRDETESPLVREALEWFVRLRDERLPAAERGAFEDWLGRSDEHRRAWAQAEQLWARFDTVDSEVRQRRRKAGALGRRAVLGLGAATAVGLGAWWALRPENGADFRSGTGEILTARLPDGSLAELSSQSALSVDFSEGGRRLVLHHGEAYFTVAADGRPFVVAAGGGEVRALGTRFNLRALDGAVTVGVAEHAVAVSVGGRPATRVEAGWQVAYRPEGVGEPGPADMASIEAWRTGRLIFRNTPLREVLREIERYRGGLVVLLDQAVGEIPVTAAFEVARIGQALDTIEVTLPIRLLRATGFVTLVQAR